MAIPYERLDNKKVYCKHCFSEGKIKCLNFDEIIQRYKLCEKHSYLKSNIRTLRFQNGKWVIARGLGLNAKPQQQGMVHKVCKNCGFVEDSIVRYTTWQCPKCSWLPENSLKLLDHTEFKYTHICRNSKCKSFGIMIKDHQLTQNWRCPDCGMQEDDYFHCIKCGTAVNSSFSKCPKCGYDPQKDLFKCKNCGAAMTNHHAKCPKCGFIHEQLNLCPKCGKKYKMGHTCVCGYDPLFAHRSRQALINVDKLNTFHDALCEDCKCITEHDGFGNCMLCVKRGMPANFVEKKSILHFLNPLTKEYEPVQQIVDRLQDGTYQLSEFPGWNVRFGKYCYGMRDVLSDEIYPLSESNFMQKDVLYCLNRSTGQYEPWESMKASFMKNVVTSEEFRPFMMPTFITKELPENCGHAAFDQNLADEGIGWFAYVKFYEANNNSKIKPLVAGKSGSTLVNSSGSDLSFSMDMSHGPARRFLVENGLNWCYEQVAVFLCNSEEETYKLENKLVTKYGLFGS